MPSPLRQLQADIFHRLKDEAAFADTHVIMTRPRTASEAVLIQGAIDKALAGLIKVNDKAGLCVNVLIPDGEVPQPDTPGPQMEGVIHVEVFENPLVNMSDGGTGIEAETCVENVLNALHLWQRGSHTLMADRRAVREVERPGAIAFHVVFRQKLGAAKQTRASAPALSYAAGNVTLTAESGAAIYSTTDGTPPSPTNTTATLYSAPFAAAAGVTVRAAAYLAGKLGSAITEKLLS